MSALEVTISGMSRRSLSLRPFVFSLNVILLAVLCVIFLKGNVFSSDTVAPAEEDVLPLDGTTIIGHIDFPPLIYPNASGESVGFIADVTRLVLERCGLFPKYKLVTLPTKRVMNYLISGQTPFTPLIKGIPILEDKVIYSDSELAAVRINAYHIGERAWIEDLNDLKGKQVIGLRGYSYGGRITQFISDPANEIVYHLCDSHESGFGMLLRKRGDCFIDYQSPSEVVFKTLKIENLQSTKLAVMHVFFNISKNTPDYLKLKEGLDRAYRELFEEGKFDQIDP